MKESFVFVMQSLGKKWNSSKDFKFTSNEGTWKTVTKETVINCFKKAAIKWNQLSLLIQITHFKNFQKKLLELKSADP